MHESQPCRFENHKTMKLKIFFSRNWEDLLMLTDPEKWSAAAVYQATRIFTSTLKEKMAQRFFNQVT
jgi:RNA polymerase subunit RPABC4/transcription elongation factor Spt4